MSNMTDIENLRHAEICGKLLTILAEDYVSRMTSVPTLRAALDLRGFALTEDRLAWHLTYLEDSGYVKIWRTSDMPGYRSDRDSGSPDLVRFTKLTPRGIQLIDGNCPEDPKVRF